MRSRLALVALGLVALALADAPAPAPQVAATPAVAAQLEKEAGRPGEALPPARPSFEEVTLAVPALL